MGQESAEEAGTLSYASNVVQGTRMGAETYQPNFLCADGYSAWWTDGGIARTSQGLTELDSDLFA